MKGPSGGEWAGGVPRSVELCVGGCVLSFWPGGAAWLRSLVGVGWRTICVLKSRFRADTWRAVDRAVLERNLRGGLRRHIRRVQSGPPRAARQSPVPGSGVRGHMHLETGSII